MHWRIYEPGRKIKLVGAKTYLEDNNYLDTIFGRGYKNRFIHGLWRLLVVTIQAEGPGAAGDILKRTYSALAGENPTSQRELRKLFDFDEEELGEAEEVGKEGIGG